MSLREDSFIVCIPWTSVGATKWHPTESTGQWSVLTRGDFRTHREAVEWGRRELGGTPYSVVRIRGLR